METSKVTLNLSCGELAEVPPKASAINAWPVISLGVIMPAFLVSSLLKSSNVFCENDPSGLVLMISDAFNTQTPP